MKPLLLVTAGAMVLTACGGSKDARIAADSASRDIQLATTDSTAPFNDAAPIRTDPPVAAPAPAPHPAAPRPRPPAPAPAPTPPPAPTPAPAPAPPPAPARLEPGTIIEATSLRELSSRTNKPGETFTATIASAVSAEDGRVVIPAGTEVTFTIVTLKPAPNKSAKDGTIVFKASGMVVKGEFRPIDGEVTFVEHTLKGRGVTGSEAAKVGVGAAAGAILGRVIGGGGTGTAAGAVVGGAAGAAVAVESADRDVIVAVGAKIKFVLRSAMTAAD